MKKYPKNPLGDPNNLLKFNSHSFIKGNVRCMACEDKRYVTYAERDYAKAKRCPNCPSECTTCNGEGFTFRKKDNGYRYVVECEDCGNLDYRIANFNKAKLPARYHNRNFRDLQAYYDNDPQKPIGNLSKIASYLVKRSSTFYEEYERGILLTGNVGTGKTHLLVALIKALTLEKGIKCRFTEFTHLLSDLRTAYERRSGANELMNALSEVPVLAIDELGKGRNNEWQISIIDELISKRYNRSLPTFCTTNYPLYPPDKPKGIIDTEAPNFQADLAKNSLTDRLGPRIVSRCMEMMDVIQFKDIDDYRKRSLITLPQLDENRRY